MRYFCRLSEVYSDLWRAFIRPPRDIYFTEQLGPKQFIIGDTTFVRHDFYVLNHLKHNLACSYFAPKHSNKPLPCVIYLHGNCSSRLEAILCGAIQALLPRGLTLCCFDFSGSGLSDGEWVTLGVNEAKDLHAVINYLQNNMGITQFGLWGRSMGAVTALLYAGGVAHNGLAPFEKVTPYNRATPSEAAIPSDVGILSEVASCNGVTPSEGAIPSEVAPYNGVTQSEETIPSEGVCNGVSSYTPIPLKAIVADSAFASLRRLAEELSKNIVFASRSLPRLIALYAVNKSIRERCGLDIDKLNPIEGVSKIKIPGLFIAAKNDIFIDPKHTQDIYEVSIIES